MLISNISLCVGNTVIRADFGNVWPLGEAQNQMRNSIHLLDHIDSTLDFVTEISTAGCITWPQRLHILNLVQLRDRNEKLLEFITRRSIADFENFIKVLSKEQRHLVPLLITDGGELVL